MRYDPDEYAKQLLPKDEQGVSYSDRPDYFDQYGNYHFPTDIILPTPNTATSNTSIPNKSEIPETSDLSNPTIILQDPFMTKNTETRETHENENSENSEKKIYLESKKQFRHDIELVNDLINQAIEIPLESKRIVSSYLSGYIDGLDDFISWLEDDISMSNK